MLTLDNKKGKEKRITSIDSWAVKYRPRSFDDFIGNKSQVNIITSFIKNMKMPKTWLFSGMSGSGKTTLARMLAQVINCENLKKGDINPCNECTSCKLARKMSHPDIKEINASSEAGNVDEVRSIVNQARFKPNYYMKVFIIDEAHGLSFKAKESLLKPLEEPPKQTVWILCTTAPEKMPEAVYGRCQKIFLSYPSYDELESRLKEILSMECSKKVAKKVEKYLPEIINASGYQPRDAISLLQQVASLIEAGKTKIDIQSIFKGSVENIQGLARKFISYYLYGKKITPTKILFNVTSEGILQEFINQVIMLSNYGYMFMLDDKNIKQYRDFFKGVNTIRWDSVLSHIKKSKVKPYKLLVLTSSMTESLEKLRMGLVSEQGCVAIILNNLFGNEKGSK